MLKKTDSVLQYCVLL